jgi:hypothetical protein
MRGLAVSVVLLAAVGCASHVADTPARPVPRRAEPVAALAPAAPAESARTAAERAENEAGYRTHVHGMRQFLLHRHLGEWVVIAGGRAFPVNEHGTMVRPARTMEEADAAARAAVPNARHRFVFRIGEEGDLEQSLGGAEIPHVLGVSFIAELERPDVEMRGLGPGQPIYFVKDGARTELTAKGPDNRMFLRPEVGPPGGRGRAAALYGLSTGFSGYVVLPSETAAAAELDLWEVPGKIRIDGLFQSGDCRRARARFRFPKTDLDFLLPVAIWPERP